MPLGSFLKRSLSRRGPRDGRAAEGSDHDNPTVVDAPLQSTHRQIPEPLRSQGRTITPPEHHERESAEDPSIPLILSESALAAPLDQSLGLTKRDLRSLFSGAPHFMLEKGRRRRCYPQAFYPWNSDLETGDLQDRRHLENETFALATLHAHLPVPDRLDFSPSSLGPLKQEDAWKRPAFEIGVLEVPNMLAHQGKEPGTVGLRHFLELPIADGRLKGGYWHGDVDNSSEGKHLDSIGKHARQQSLCQVIHGTPDMWKQLGVRNITADILTDRLALISTWHDEVVRQGWLVTVLDKERSDTLGEVLFTQLIYPLPGVSPNDSSKSLKAQIEALAIVLTTPEHGTISVSLDRALE